MGEIRSLSPSIPVVLQFVLDGQDPSLVERLRGPQGTPGLKGDVGVKGADSTVPGPKGNPGKDGLDGRNGRDGKDAQDGKDGITGPAGWSPTREELKALIKEVLAGL